MTNRDKNFIVEKIRTSYTETEKTQTDIEKLRELDKKVTRPATIFGYVFGGISALVAGSGMSLVMTNIGAALGSAAMPVGIAIGIVGFIGALLTYPIFSKILKSRRKKYKDEILELSNRIIDENK